MMKKQRCTRNWIGVLACSGVSKIKSKILTIVGVNGQNACSGNLKTTKRILKGSLALSTCLSLWTVNPDLEAATFIVDRDPANESADYSSLSEAIEAAAASDIVYLMPSGVAYELETIDKSITIIGSGFGKEIRFPNAPTETSKIDHFTIHADNVFLSGLVFEGGVVLKTPSRGITFFRNYFPRNSDGNGTGFSVSGIEGSPEAPVSDLHLINNWFARTRIRMSTECINLRFISNVMNGGFMLLDSGSGDIANNYIQANQEGTFSYQRTGIRVPLDGRFYNNILRNGNGLVDVSSDFISHNLIDEAITSASEFSESNNPRYSDFSAVATGKGNFGDWLKLVDNSPAIGAGLNGDDIGIFGGLHPWDDDMQPPLPIITHMEAPSVVGSGQGFDVTIEVKSNQ
jgi:hypothetical protein